MKKNVMKRLAVLASRASRSGSKGHDNVVDSLQKLARKSKPSKLQGPNVGNSLAIEWKSRADSILSNLEHITPFRVAHTVYCCRMGGYWNVDLFAGLVRGVLAKPRLMVGFQPIDVAMTVQSLGMIAREQRENQNQEALEFFDQTGGQFVKRLMEMCVETGMFGEGRRKRVDARMLANVIHGLGLCWENVPNFQEGEEVLVIHKSIKQMLAAMMQAKDNISPLDFSNAIHGCAKVGFRDSDSLREMFDLLTRCLVMQPSEFCPQSLASITWATGKLGHKDHGLLNVLGGFFVGGLGNFSEQHLANVMQSFGLLGYTNEKVLSVFEGEILSRLENRPGKFNEQVLASIVHSLGSLTSCQKNEKLLEALGTEIAKDPRMGKLNCQNLANIVYGFGKCGFFKVSVLTRLLSASIRKLQEFSPQGLVSLVYGVALVQVSATGAMSDTIVGLLQKVSMEVKKRGIDSLNELEICTLCWSLGELRFYDEELFGSLIVEYMTNSRTDAMTNSETDFGKGKSAGMRMVMGACAVLGMQNAPYIEQLRDGVLLELEKGTGGIRGATHSLWSLAILGVLSTQDFDKLCEYIDVFKANGEVLGAKDSMQLVQGWLYVSLLGGANPTSKKWQHLIDFAKEKCIQSTLESKFEKTVQSYLQELGVEFQLNVRLVEGLLPVDVFVPNESGGGSVVECDGLYHCTINKIDGKSQQMGVTLFRNRILQAAGYKVLCLPYFMEKAKKKELLRELIKLEKVRGGREGSEQEL